MSAVCEIEYVANPDFVAATTESTSTVTVKWNWTGGPLDRTPTSPFGTDAAGWHRVGETNDSKADQPGVVHKGNGKASFFYYEEVTTTTPGTDAVGDEFIAVESCTPVPPVVEPEDPVDEPEQPVDEPEAPVDEEPEAPVTDDPADEVEEPVEVPEVLVEEPVQPTDPEGIKDEVPEDIATDDPSLSWPEIGEPVVELHPLSLIDDRVYPADFELLEPDGSVQVPTVKTYEPSMLAVTGGDVLGPVLLGALLVAAGFGLLRMNRKKA